MEFRADISETEMFKHYPEVLNMLLKDCTTGRNIFWASDSYKHLGQGYQFNDEITIEHITGENGMVIRPRVLKKKKEKSVRTKGMAEVFTPAWVCNLQNNLVDDYWFERSNVFNIVDETERNWVVNTQKVTFPTGKTWEAYVRLKRLEITCGEAPYLVSRYDTTTGEPIDLERRIGLLDRKLRVVGENTKTRDEWLRMAHVAYENIYGYEWQGDNLLLAREALIVSFIEYYYAKFGKVPQEESLLSIAEIISWNLWQMDGLKCVVPKSCHPEKIVVQNLFDTKEIVKECEGCKTGDIHKHNGIYCKIKDWSNNEILSFESLIKDGK